jgi:flavin reductase (DIM6/NTAB) family NADH-FMN oxidoreductase RutF
MIIDPDTLDPQSCYKLLIGSVVPRPIAWTSTVSREGVHNLVPFSFFTVASRNPPMLCISVGPRADQPPDTKDTLSNITEMGEFERAGLTPAPCEVVTAPRVKEAAVSMECFLDRVLELGTDHLIIGRMVRFHVRDELYESGRIDVAKLQPLGRLAGNYTKVETIFELPSEDF